MVSCNHVCSTSCLALADNAATAVQVQSDMCTQLMHAFMSDCSIVSKHSFHCILLALQA